MDNQQEIARQIVKLESRLTINENNFVRLEQRIKEGLVDINKNLEKLVTQTEFTPIKLIVYGMVTMVLTSVFTAILITVIRNAP